MTDTNDTVKPWAKKGLTIASRAFAVAVNHHCKDAEQSIREAIESARAEALADAAPKVEWLPTPEDHFVNAPVIRTLRSCKAPCHNFTRWPRCRRRRSVRNGTRLWR